jgi:hypothetical protein
MANTLKTYTRKERNYYLLGLTGQNVIYNVIGVSAGGVQRYRENSTDL